MGVRLEELENVLSERNFSQADLARRSGLSAHTIGRAVRDGEPVSYGSARKIARALCVQVDSLRDPRYSDGKTRPRLDAGTRPVEGSIEPRRLKRAMAERGMNLTEVAAKTGLAVATVSSALRGTRSPRQETLEKIAEAVGVEAVMRYPARYEPVETGGRIKLRAGQQSAVLYPKEEDGSTVAEGAVVDEAVAAAASRATSSTLVGVKSEPVQAMVEPAAEGWQYQRQDAPWALEELYSQLQQTRHILTSLLEHVGGLEEQIRCAAASRRGEQDGAW